MLVKRNLETSANTCADMEYTRIASPVDSILLAISPTSSCHKHLEHAWTLGTDKFFKTITMHSMDSVSHFKGNPTPPMMTIRRQRGNSSSFRKRSTNAHTSERNFSLKIPN
jgi:hypothetical protein